MKYFGDLHELWDITLRLIRDCPFAMCDCHFLTSREASEMMQQLKTLVIPTPNFYPIPREEYPEQVASEKSPMHRKNKEKFREKRGLS